MSRKKLILTAIILVMVVVIGGLLAYFTDTETATNSFTIGNVDIELTEPAWSALTDTDGNGIPDIAENITPETTIAKDPKITNKSNTNSAYVFVKVEVPAKNSTTPLFTYTTNTGWTEIGTASYADGKITHIYAYATESGNMKELKHGESTNAVFNEVKFGSFTSTQLTGVSTSQSIVVTGYGIQTDNLGTATTPAQIFALFNN